MPYPKKIVDTEAEDQVADLPPQGVPQVGSEAPSEAPSAPVSNPDTSNSVILSKDDFESLMGRLAAVESKSNIDQKEPTKSGAYRQVKVRFIGEDMVVGYGKSWEEKQIDGDKKLMLEVFTGGRDGLDKEKKRHLVKFVEFYESGEYLWADILKIHENFDEKKFGKVAKVRLSKDEWNMEETGEYIDSVVRIPNFIYELRLADGRTIALHQSALN